MRLSIEASRKNLKKKGEPPGEVLAEMDGDAAVGAGAAEKLQFQNRNSMQAWAAGLKSQGSSDYFNDYDDLEEYELFATASAGRKPGSKGGTRSKQSRSSMVSKNGTMYDKRESLNSAVKVLRNNVGPMNESFYKD